jgi:hypothetical protein
MPFPALPVAMVAGFLQKNAAEKEAKQKMIAQMLAQQGASQGASTAGYQAQQGLNAIEAQPSPTSQLMSGYLQKRAQAPADGAAPEEEEDLLAGLF